MNTLNRSPLTLMDCDRPAKHQRKLNIRPDYVALDFQCFAIPAVLIILPLGVTNIHKLIRPCNFNDNFFISKTPYNSYSAINPSPHGIILREHDLSTTLKYQLKRRR